MIKFKIDWPPKNKRKPISAQNLHGVRITLCHPALNHYANWHEVRARNQDHLKPFEPKWPKNCLMEDFYKRRISRQKNDMQNSRGAFYFIFSKETNAILGGINLNNIQYGAACHASLGYWLDEAAQGQGYMRESIALLIEHAFHDLKLRRLNAACLPHNERSAKLLLNQGFTEEGYALKYLQINGHWQDHRLFGLNAPEA